MFKIGEKVVCINNGELKQKNGKFFKPDALHLKMYQIYTVKNNNGGNDDILLEEINVYYDNRRFIPLLEYRKQKIDKIKENICSKKVT